MQQSAFDKIDTYASPQKQVKQLRMLVDFYHEALAALRSGVSLDDIRAMNVITKIIRSKYEIPNNEMQRFDDLHKAMLEEFQHMRQKEAEAVVE